MSTNSIRFDEGELEIGEHHYASSLLYPILVVLFAVVIMGPVECYALAPEEVVVVANKMAWHSCDLAEYYMKRREIPAENLIELKAPVTEHCSRDDYEAHIASPIRAFLKKNDPEGSRFRCLVTMYGIPLRVHPPGLTPEERKRLSELERQRSSKREQIKEAGQEQDNKELEALRDAEAKINRQIDQVRKVFQGAAVDSELALVREDHYSLAGWLPNKYFLGYRGKKIENMPQKALLVSRLDGPSEDIVRRIIDDSLETEGEGLRGTAYFDARWPDPGDKELTGYAFYDRAIH
ncbi:MAG: TIGR03790 family protein, partial [Deltaproteobacteria bacterium]|nr:TIGR03790 family protein [Deltaproteobacteria bacterium]